MPRVAAGRLLATGSPGGRGPARFERVVGERGGQGPFSLRGGLCGVCRGCASVVPVVPGGQRSLMGSPHSLLRRPLFCTEQRLLWLARPLSCRPLPSRGRHPSVAGARGVHTVPPSPGRRPLAAWESVGRPPMAGWLGDGVRAQWVSGSGAHPGKVLCFLRPARGRAQHWDCRGWWDVGLAGTSVNVVHHMALQACAACSETSPLPASPAHSGGGPRPPL